MMERERQQNDSLANGRLHLRWLVQKLVPPEFLRGTKACRRHGSVGDVAMTAAHCMIRRVQGGVFECVCMLCGAGAGGNVCTRLALDTMQSAAKVLLAA